MNRADWRPSAPIALLRRRAELLAAARAFFGERGVLEVQTPVVLSRTVTDTQIASLALPAAPGEGAPRFLQTSPEYPMKRLLAAGSGDVFQICPTFRAGERSRLHNPEFTMLEWYRLGFDLRQIMEETTALVAGLLARPVPLPVEFLTYREALARRFGQDVLALPIESLGTLCVDQGLAQQSRAAMERDQLLDFLVAAIVGPALGSGRLTCLHHYPASQAALARTDPEDPATALRFELYAEGVELANGYVELANAAEQRARFQADQAQRAARGLPRVEADERLLAALEAGLPACAGVALGFDRVVMLATGASSIDQVMSFTWERA